MGLTNLVRKALLGGALATASVGAVGIAENVAYAARSETIQDHYKRAKPADYLMPGARVMKSSEGDTLLGQAELFRGNQWLKFYLDDPTYSSGLQQIFRELDGTTLINPTTGVPYLFDFNKFHDFMLQAHSNVGGVGLFYEGYINFLLKNGRLSVTIPIPSETIKKAIDL